PDPFPVAVASRPPTTCEDYNYKSSEQVTGCNLHRGLCLYPQIWVDEAPHPALRFTIRIRTHPESIPGRGKGIRQRVGPVHLNNRFEILWVAHWPLAGVFV
ncbi:MAG: hypothetical protein V3R25_02550, partial [Nitrosomonadaceae bacterium]